MPIRLYKYIIESLDVCVCDTNRERFEVEHFNARRFVQVNSTRAFQPIKLVALLHATNVCICIRMRVCACLFVRICGCELNKGSEFRICSNDFDFVSH